MRLFRTLLLMQALLIAGSAAHAAPVYRHIDAQGRVTWSDRPGGALVDITAPRVISPTATARDSSATHVAAPSVFVPYRRLALTGAPDTVSAEQGRQGVALRLDMVPRREGDRVQLLINGKRHQSALASRVLVATGLVPGRHELVAEILDSAGIARQRSSVVILNVLPESAPSL